jgi:hypothetical protein
MNILTNEQMNVFESDCRGNVAEITVTNKTKPDNDCCESHTPLVTHSTNDILTSLRPPQDPLYPTETWTLARPCINLPLLYNQAWDRSIFHFVSSKWILDSILACIFVQHPKALLVEWRKEFFKTVTGVVTTWDMVIACDRAQLRKLHNVRISSTDAQNVIQRIRSVNDAELETETINAIETNEHGVDCSICMDPYHTNNMITCQSSPRHFTCIPCAILYITKSRELRDPLSAIPCPVSECKTMYKIDRLKTILPKEIQTNITEKDFERNINVALHANVKCVIYCTCGVHGIVEHNQDNTDEKAQCICGLIYCSKCGNEFHTESCPPARDILRWVSGLHGKACPNCGMAIEKNGGCNHLTCIECRYDFCWECLGPYPHCNCE